MLARVSLSFVHLVFRSYSHGGIINKISFAVPYNEE